MFENQLVVGAADPASHRPQTGQIRVPLEAPIEAPSGAETAELLKAFWRYQARRGLSGATQTAYGQYLAQFVAWLGTRPLQTVRPADIDLGYLAAWDDSFRHRYGRSP